MNISFLESRNIKVYSIQDDTPVGKLYDLLIDTKDGSIKAFWIKHIDFLFPKNKVILFSDVIKWTKLIYIHDLSSLSDFEEIVRLKNAKEDHFPLINKPVYSVSNIYLGFLEDYLFSLEKKSITKLIVNSQNIFRQKKTNNLFSIDKKNIVKLSSEKIVVKDINTIQEEEEDVIDLMPIPTY